MGAANSVEVKCVVYAGKEVTELVLPLLPVLWWTSLRFKWLPSRDQPVYTAIIIIIPSYSTCMVLLAICAHKEHLLTQFACMYVYRISM